MFLSYKKRKFKIEKAITFKTIGDFELKGDVYRPNAPGLKPAILVVHGGGWFKKSGDMQSLCKRLARDGFVVFNATYRLAPKHTYPSAVDDLRDALAWLKVSANKYEIDINKISGWGYSAGAHLLLLVGLNPEANLKALVCGGTPADFSVWKSSPLVKGFMGCTYEENAALWNAASPVNQVQAASPPVFMYHGEWDFIVEIAQMQKMAQALESKNRPVETLRIPRMEHFGVYLFNRAWVDAGIKFIREQIN